MTATEAIAFGPQPCSMAQPEAAAAPPSLPYPAPGTRGGGRSSRLRPTTGSMRCRCAPGRQRLCWQGVPVRCACMRFWSLARTRAAEQPVGLACTCLHAVRPRGTASATCKRYKRCNGQDARGKRQRLSSPGLAISLSVRCQVEARVRPCSAPDEERAMCY